MRRLNYRFVKSQFEKESYKLLSVVYINQREKLEYICSNGHKHSISWSDWNNNRRCPYCGKMKRIKKRRKSFKDIENSFNAEGYKLLTKVDEYKNAEQKLFFICPKGHQYSISWHNWKSGWRCKYCHHDKLSLIFTGSGHPQWKGGISCEPYCDAWADKEYKESIKARDNYECQNPDCWKTNFVLTIHHIDYDKKNCGPDNLITLCRSCNARANFNRKYHKQLYSNLLINRR